MSGASALMTTCSVVGLGGVVMSTPAFKDMINIVTNLDGHPVIISVAITSLLVGVCGSGTGGEAMSLPMIKEYFVPMGANVEALTRGIALSTMITTLPSNGVVNTAIAAASSTHKQSYPLLFFAVSCMSLLIMIILLALFALFGYM
jgi:H+/gluconate symporter-like permease